MFDPEFYPTPDKVIEKMLAPYYVSGEEWYGFNPRKTKVLKPGLTILDPEAGSGAILDYISKTNSRDLELYCCENDPHLKEMLKGKGYAMISEDFFEYKGDILFDLIVMNPPFSNGDKHLLHAWKILEEGNIVCLLNEETIKNPHTETRKHLLSLIEKFGSVEYLGDCFADAERKTSVNIAMVRLKKVCEKNRFHFDFDKVASKEGFDMDEKTFESAVATNDVIGNMMVQFENIQKYFVEFAKARQGLGFYSNSITQAHFNPVEKAINAIKEKPNYKSAYNKFSADVRNQMWKIVIEKSKIEKFMTSSLRKDFGAFIKSQGSMDFNKENVSRLINFIFMNRVTILEKAVVDVFENFTSYHAENRYMVEGWKTNSKYKVNQKVILPRAIQYGQYSNAHDLKEYGDKFTIAYNKGDVYGDIDRVMCYLTGKKYETCITIEDSLKALLHEVGRVRTGEKFKQETESTFFDIKFFKKGTMHITFKDKRLWEEFNMRACLKMNWLPTEEAHEYEKRKKKESEKSNQTSYQEKEPEMLLLELF